MPHIYPQSKLKRALRSHARENLLAFPLNQIVPRTIVFCDERRPHLVGIKGEQFQELLIHEFHRQCGDDLGRRWPLYEMMTGGMPKVARDPEYRVPRRLSQYVINRELRFKAEQARLPPAGRSAHGFSPGRSRRRA